MTASAVGLSSRTAANLLFPELTLPIEGRAASPLAQPSSAADSVLLHSSPIYPLKRPEAGDRDMNLSGGSGLPTVIRRCSEGLLLFLAELVLQRIREQRTPLQRQRARRQEEHLPSRRGLSPWRGWE